MMAPINSMAPIDTLRRPVRTALMLCAAWVTVPHSADAQDRYPMDWEAVAAESMEYFLELLRTDTSNPPGN